MKRVFLSLPMTGRTVDEIEKQIQSMKNKILKSKYFGDEAVVFVHNLGAGLIDLSVSDSYEEHSIKYRNVEAVCRNEPLLYLSTAIVQMSYVDYVFFGSGWTKSRGCRIERDVAKLYNIPILNCRQSTERRIGVYEH